MGRQGPRLSTGPAAIAILAMLWMGADGGGGRVGAAGPTVQELEAALVLSFARFVEWPAEEFRSPTAPIVIGIVADEAVAAALEARSRGQNVAGRTVAVERVQWDGDVADMHVLFIGDGARRHLGVVLERVRALPIVTVSPIAEFGRAGGMITLAFTGGRVTFAVNTHATASNAVRLSSFLLTHASSVSDQSGGVPR